MKTLFADIPLADWGYALLVAVALFAGVALVRWLVSRRFPEAAGEETPGTAVLIGRLWRGINRPLLALFAAGVGLATLEPAAVPEPWVRALLVAAMVIQAALWGNILIAFAVTHAQARDAGERTATVRTLAFIGRLALYTVVVLLVLDNIPGVHLTALLTGLGVGGVAVALAVQNILSDLFASLSISLDRPFVLGDFIVVDDCLGTVEYIGLKTTRLRSLSGEQLIFANTDLLKSRIRNYKRMAERRVVFSFGVVYQTPAAQVEAIPGMVRAVIEAQAQTRFDRAHFKAYGDSALQFEVVYYVLSPDYNLYMDIQQAINLTLFRRFEEAGIQFAYPTQTLYVQNAAVESV